MSNNLKLIRNSNYPTSMCDLLAIHHGKEDFYSIRVATMSLKDAQDAIAGGAPVAWRGEGDLIPEGHQCNPGTLVVKLKTSIKANMWPWDLCLERPSGVSIIADLGPVEAVRLSEASFGEIKPTEIDKKKLRLLGKKRSLASILNKAEQLREEISVLEGEIEAGRVGEPDSEAPAP